MLRFVRREKATARAATSPTNQMLLFIDRSQGLGCRLQVNLTAGEQSKNIMQRLTKLGRAFFACRDGGVRPSISDSPLAASAPALGPPWTPAPHFWGYVSAIILVAAAAGMATGTLAGCSTISLAILFFVRVLLAYVPRLVANIHDPGPWTSGSEILSLCGAALVLGGVMKLGRILFAAPLLVFGVQHFLYARFIATLVPAWIPGRLLWAYFIGVAFVAAALSIATQKRLVCRQLCWASCFFCGYSYCICPEWLRRHTTEMSGRVCLWRWPCLVDRF